MSLSSTTPADEEAVLLKPRSAFRIKKIHLWAILPFAIAWFAASIDMIEPFDFWWNVKSGQIMMQTGQFLGTDVLVWSPVREPYSNPQWGSQLLFYWFYAISPYLMLTMRRANHHRDCGIAAMAVHMALASLCAWGACGAGSLLRSVDQLRYAAPIVRLPAFCGLPLSA